MKHEMNKLCIVILGAVLFVGNVLAQVDPVAPNVPGYVPVTIVPGTNVVENLPFTAAMLPRLSGDALVSFWEERNDQLRNLGIRLISLED